MALELLLTAVFNSVFPDLPIVTMPKGTIVKGPLEKVLLLDWLTKPFLSNNC